jgi:hypothetical protein
LKTHHKNRADGVAQGVGPEFKPQYHKKQNKTTTKKNQSTGLLKGSPIPTGAEHTDDMVIIYADKLPRLHTSNSRTSLSTKESSQAGALPVPASRKQYCLSGF